MKLRVVLWRYSRLRILYCREGHDNGNMNGRKGSCFVPLSMSYPIGGKDRYSDWAPSMMSALQVYLLYVRDKLICLFHTVDGWGNI